MCKCDPHCRTMYCGKGDCVWPKEKLPNYRLSKAKWLMLDTANSVQQWQDPISSMILSEEQALKWIEARVNCNGGGFKLGFALMDAAGWINYRTFAVSAFECMLASQKEYDAEWETLKVSWKIVPVKMEITGPEVTDL